jgi:hypothetical protein
VEELAASLKMEAEGSFGKMVNLYQTMQNLKFSRRRLRRLCLTVCDAGYSSALKTEATCSSEILGNLYQITRCHQSPKRGNCITDYRYNISENLYSQTLISESQISHNVRASSFCVIASSVKLVYQYMFSSS